MKFIQSCLVLFLSVNTILAQSQKSLISSPDKKLSAGVWISEDKHVFYNVILNDQPLLTISKLGIICEDGDYSKDLTWLSVSPPVVVTDKYETYNAKRRINSGGDVLHLNLAIPAPSGIGDGRPLGIRCSYNAAALYAAANQQRRHYVLIVIPAATAVQKSRGSPEFAHHDNQC